MFGFKAAKFLVFSGPISASLCWPVDVCISVPVTEKFFQLSYSTKMFDATEERTTAQMTIFYEGQVIVYNDFPADKAKEVMVLASKGSSSQQFTPRPALAPKILNNQFESSARVLPSPSMSSDRFRDSHQWPVMQIAPRK